MRGIVTADLHRGGRGARRVIRFAALLCGLCVCLSAGQWFRLTSMNFEVLTDAGERTGRRTIAKLEQLNQAFVGLGSGGLRSPLPVTVYIFSSAKGYELYQPSATTQGFFRGGSEEDYIVMLASAREGWRIAFHEYVHVILRHTSVRLPQWLEEGTAEFYSTVEMHDAKLVIGNAVRDHLGILRRERWMTAEELAGVNHESRVYKENHRLGIFYAQSWAMAHMLQMSPDYQTGADRYANLLAEGIEPGKAFAQAFNRTFEEAVNDLRQYARRGHWQTTKIDWVPLADVEIEVEQLDENQAVAAQLRLQLSLGMWEVSEAQLERLARKKGTSAEIENARARIAMGRQDIEAAGVHFRSSIEQGSIDASTYFEYAMLLRETRGDRAEVIELLRKTVALNPAYAEAHFLLASEATREDRPAAAIPHLLKAVRVMPRRSYFWHALASAYYQTEEMEQARQAARRAVDSARTRQELEMAQAVVQMVAEPREKRVADNRPEVTTPDSWNAPAGDSRAEGVLERIDCLEEQAVLVVRTGDTAIRLLVRDPSQVTLRGMDVVSFEFACGVARSASVSVEYAAKEKGEHDTAGDVTAIEFAPPDE
jgi:tetratricopeptide (TPR) repeat protein